MQTANVYIRQIAFGGLFILLLVGALFLSQFLSTFDTAIQLMERAGYGGLVLLGIIGGLNVFVPIPAAVFTELYTAAGLSVFGIILALAFGTLLADMIGFWFGQLMRVAAHTSYPKIVSFVTNIREQYTYLVLPFVGFYAAFVPFPNEAILIPLAISGINIRYLLIPLIIGNLIHQAVLIYGLQGLFRLLGL